jgi:hypothetical protein
LTVDDEDRMHRPKSAVGVLPHPPVSRELTKTLTGIRGLDEITGGAIERTETTISSLMDTWIRLANDEVGGQHRRGLYVLKSRGMAHSNELREFVLTDHGLTVLDAAGGPQQGGDRYAAV